MSYKTPSSKTFIQILLIVLLAVFVGRVMYRVVWEREGDISQESRSLAHLRAREAVKDTAPFLPPMPEGFSYDFRRMIRLIDACGKIKRETEFRFEGDLLISQSSVDHKNVVTILNELMQERLRLKNYIWDLKGYAHTGISVKRYRSLLYYMEVLENNIVEMRDLLARRK